MKYAGIERILGTEWITDHSDHLYNQWVMRPEDSRERMLLSYLEKYLEKATLRRTKRIRDKLRNLGEFVDSLYELEVGCLLIDNGFAVAFEPTLSDKIGSPRTPDIFVEKENIVVEVKTLHESDRVRKGIESGKTFEFNESLRIKGVISNELEKWRNGIEYPLIIVIRPDEIEKPLVTSDDFEAELLGEMHRVDFSRAGGLCWTFDVEYRGRYFLDEGRNARELSGLVWWKQPTKLFYENRNVDKHSKIPQGRFLDFLKREFLCKI